MVECQAKKEDFTYGPQSYVSSAGSCRFRFPRQRIKCRGREVQRSLRAVRGLRQPTRKATARGGMPQRPVGFPGFQDSCGVEGRQGSAAGAPRAGRGRMGRREDQDSLPVERQQLLPAPQRRSGPPRLPVVSRRVARLQDGLDAPLGDCSLVLGRTLHRRALRGRRRRVRRSREREEGRRELRAVPSVRGRRHRSRKAGRHVRAPCRRSRTEALRGPRGCGSPRDSRRLHVGRRDHRHLAGRHARRASEAPRRGCLRQAARLKGDA